MDNLDTLLAPPGDLVPVSDIIDCLSLGSNAGTFPKHSFTMIDYSHVRFALPLRIEFAGRDEWIAGCYRHIRKRDMFTMECVLEGDAAFAQDGQTFLAGSGDIFFCQPFSDTILAAGPSGRCLKLVVAMTGSVLDESLSRMGIGDLHFLSEAHTGTLKQRMQAVCRAVNGPHDIARLCGVACALLVALSRHVEHVDDPPILRRALALIENRLHSTLRLGELARHCGCSPSALCSLFKARFGCSPIAYYIDRKMRFAQHMLRHDNALIKQVAYNLGYRGQLYFSSEFRKRVGSSPSEYRRHIAGR